MTGTRGEKGANCSNQPYKGAHSQSRMTMRFSVLSGVIAGILATLAQVLLWLIFTDAFPAILFRDARLTAALVLGDSVLPPPDTFNLGIMLTATLIHFTLSITYTFLLVVITARLDAVKALLAGIGFGIAIYMVNLYGFTALFPWFSKTRGWLTLIAHVVFGVAAISAYRWMDINNVQSRPGVH